MNFFTRNISRYILPLSICAFLITSCRQINVYERNTAIPGHKWNSNFSATGTFIIADTVEAYNIYIVLRHKDSYKYNNIWLNVGLQAPGDTMVIQKLNLILGSDASGWEGSGMNDIWEVRKLIHTRPRRFIKPGEYKFSISQAMRDNPLPDIMNVGLRVVKANDD